MVNKFPETKKGLAEIYRVVRGVPRRIWVRPEDVGAHAGDLVASAVTDSSSFPKAKTAHFEGESNQR